MRTPTTPPQRHTSVVVALTMAVILAFVILGVAKYEGSKQRTSDAGKGSSVMQHADTPLELNEITPEVIKYRVSLAEQWYLHDIGGDGFLHLQYFPSKNSYATNDIDIQQLASLWAMLRIEHFLQSNALDPVINRMLDRYVTKGTVCENNYCRIELNKKSWLSYNAFVLFSLLERPDTPDTIKLRENLARGILAEQKPDGSFQTDFLTASKPDNDYSAGEAMLALMKMYQKTNDATYMHAVEKAFPFYRTYWRGNRNTAFVPWETQGYVKLYEATHSPEVAAFVFEMNDWIISNYQITSDADKEILGAYTKKSPGIVTGVYNEGINEAYRLAQLMQDSAHATAYKNAIRLATRFLLYSQYTPKDAATLPNPARAVGGFCASLTNDSQRIDNTQHSISAVMKALANGLF